MKYEQSSDNNETLNFRELLLDDSTSQHDNNNDNKQHHQHHESVNNNWRRRIEISRRIHSIWTEGQGGHDDSGLASPFFDGRQFALGWYVMDYMDDYNCNYQLHECEGSNTNDNSAIVLDRMDASELSYGLFFNKYMVQNRPIVVTNLCKDWEATKNWVLPKEIFGEKDGHKLGKSEDDIVNSGKKEILVPNIEYFKEKFGEDVVSVHLQSKIGFYSRSNQLSLSSSSQLQGKENGISDLIQNPKEEEKQNTMKQEPRKMKLSEYMDWWIEHHNQNEEKIGANSNDNNRHGLPLYYMKDWKFMTMETCSDIYLNNEKKESNIQSKGSFLAAASEPLHRKNPYSTPPIFVDDWLNGPNGPAGNAYKFCYLGPAGSTTSFHTDVLQSYSWSSNICGTKRWYLIPPQYSYLLYDTFGIHVAEHLHVDLDDTLYSNDYGRHFFPGLVEARKHATCVIQKEGETIFVPSGWYHTVENLEGTLSINHNWINGTNILSSWERLFQEECTTRLNYHIYDDRESKDDNIGTCVDKEPLCNSNDDDILLLWLIVSRKAKLCLAFEENIVTDVTVIETNDRKLNIIDPSEWINGYGHDVKCDADRKNCNNHNFSHCHNTNVIHDGNISYDNDDNGIFNLYNLLKISHVLQGLKEVLSQKGRSIMVKRNTPELDLKPNSDKRSNDEFLSTNSYETRHIIEVTDVTLLLVEVKNCIERQKRRIKIAI